MGKDLQTLEPDYDKAVALIQSLGLEEAEAIEDRIIESGINDIDFLNENFLQDKFCKGLYARYLIIPRGTFLTGKIHRRPYIDIFVSGDITLKSYLADGTFEETERINSFRYFEGKPGRKRVLMAHEDTHWITVDPTEADSIEDVEADVVCDKMAEYHRLIGEA